MDFEKGYYDARAKLTQVVKKYKLLKAAYDIRGQKLKSAETRAEELAKVIETMRLDFRTKEGEMSRISKELVNAHEHIAEMQCCDDCDRTECPGYKAGHHCSTGNFSYYYDNIWKGNATDEEKFTG